MNDTRIQYWRDAIAAALQDLTTYNVGEVLGYPAVLDALAKDLAISAENEAMAFGDDAIPRQSDLDHLRRNQDHAIQLAAVQSSCDAWRKVAADRLGVEPHRVTVNAAGHVEVSRT